VDHLLLIGKDKGSRGGLARMFTVMRLFDAACIQGNNPILHLFPSHWGAPMIAAPAKAGDVRLKTDTVLRSLRSGEKA
jgi:hypothetical protein